MNNAKNFVGYIRKSQIRQSTEDGLGEGHEPTRPVFFCFNWKWLQSEVKRMGDGVLQKEEE